MLRWRVVDPRSVDAQVFAYPMYTRPANAVKFLDLIKTVSHSNPNRN